MQILGIGITILEEQVSVGRSAMVPLDITLVNRLSMVAMSLSEAVWPQFAMQVFGVHDWHSRVRNDPSIIFVSVQKPYATFYQ